MTLLVGCSTTPEVTNPEPPPAETPGGAPDDPAPSADSPGEPSSRAWLDTELTDVSTGETFRLSDFKGRPVLLHAFAVW
jgi:hypothetical protein